MVLRQNRVSGHYKFNDAWRKPASRESGMTSMWWSRVPSPNQALADLPQKTDNAQIFEW